MSDTYSYQHDDMAAPIECHFNHHDDGLELVKALVGGHDIFPVLAKNVIGSIEWKAAIHFEKLRDELRAERVYESRRAYA